MSSLYELTTQQLELKTKLMSMNLDEETIADTLEGNAGEIEAKIESYGFVIRDRLSFAGAMAVEIERLTARWNDELMRIEKTKEWLLSSMIALNINKIECPIFTIAVQNNPPHVEIYNDKLIPAEYMRTPEPKPPVAAPDKRLMLADMKAGKEIDGCKLTTNQKLVIK
jgi:hypothetical protein